MHWHGPTAEGTRASLIEGDTAFTTTSFNTHTYWCGVSDPNKTAKKKKPPSLCATINDAEPVEQLLIFLVLFNIILLDPIYNLFEGCTSRLTVVWAKNQNEFWCKMLFQYK